MRVELGEVESALRELTDVQAVAVSGLSRDLGRGETDVDSDMQLVAYVVGVDVVSTHPTLAAQRDAAGAHGAESLRAAGAFAVVAERQSGPCVVTGG